MPARQAGDAEHDGGGDRAEPADREHRPERGRVTAELVSQEGGRVVLQITDRLPPYQLVDDDSGKTVAASGWLHLKKTFKGDKTEQAAEVGKLLAASAKKAGVETAGFDRGGYLYHGRVKALADGAREGGLKF